jgi:hypothetical protein
MRQQVGESHRIVNIGLVSGHVLDVHRVGKHMLKALASMIPTSRRRRREAREREL